MRGRNGTHCASANLPQVALRACADAAGSVEEIHFYLPDQRVAHAFQLEAGRARLQLLQSSAALAATWAAAEPAAADDPAGALANEPAAADAPPAQEPPPLQFGLTPTTRLLLHRSSYLQFQGDVLVNAASESLLSVLGSATHRAAGPELLRACLEVSLAPCPTCHSAAVAFSACTPGNHLHHIRLALCSSPSWSLACAASRGARC